MADDPPGAPPPAVGVRGAGTRASRVLSRLLIRKSPSESNVVRPSPAERAEEERAAADWSALAPVVDARLLPRMDAVEDVRLHTFCDRTLRVPRACAFCLGLLWGAGVRVCEVCNYSCHKRCEVKVLTGSHRECACARMRLSGEAPSPQTSADAQPVAVPPTAGPLPTESAPAAVLGDAGTCPAEDSDAAAAQEGTSGEHESAATGLVNEHHLPRTKKRTIVDTIRSTVAKNRARYVTDEYDLDLSYITDHIIAMSFPAVGLESAYRNHLSDVARMLNEKHPEHYLIFNLHEKFYDITKFNNQVLDFGWPDHHAPPLEMLFSICMSIDSWLKSDDENVVVVHCKGGKGRTGTVVCSHMIYSRTCDTADEAMAVFATRRFVNGKEGGITQPSQKRYVRYFERIITGELLPTDGGLLLDRIIVSRIPNFDGRGGCRPVLCIYQNFKLIFDSRHKHHGRDVSPRVYTGDMDFMCFDFAPEGLYLKGDILIRCHHVGSASKEPIFRLQFHAGCVPDYYLKLTKSDLDDAVLERRFPDDGGVDVLFRPPPPQRQQLDIDSVIAAYNSDSIGGGDPSALEAAAELEDDDFSRYRYSLDHNYAGSGGLASALAIARGASRAHEAATMKRGQSSPALLDVDPVVPLRAPVADDVETNPFDD